MTRQEVEEKLSMLTVDKNNTVAGNHTTYIINAVTKITVGDYSLDIFITHYGPKGINILIVTGYQLTDILTVDIKAVSGKLWIGTDTSSGSLIDLGEV
jgi:hypothetical protein